MKTTAMPQPRNRMNIEIFDLQLLKEIRLLADEENSFEYDFYNENWVEEETDIRELSLDEFENLLHE